MPAGHDISITEMEHNRAVERGIPRLIFLMDDEHPVKARDIEKGQGAVRLEALRERLSRHHVTGFFHSPTDLRADAIHSLVEARKRLEEEAARQAGEDPLTEPVERVEDCWRHSSRRRCWASTRT